MASGLLAASRRVPTRLARRGPHRPTPARPTRRAPAGFFARRGICDLGRRRQHEGF